MPASHLVPARGTWGPGHTELTMSKSATRM